MQFLITAMGRSGTKSIAEYLGCPHELGNGLSSLILTMDRYRREGLDYGECSSYHRRIAPYCLGVRKAYIHRHPHHIALSGMARGHSVRETANGLAELYMSIDKDKEASVFYFEDLILDATPLARWAERRASGALPQCNESVPGSKEGITLSECDKNFLEPFLKTRDFTYTA